MRSFCEVSLYKEDIKRALVDAGIEPTKANIDRIVEIAVNDMDIEDRMYQRGLCILDAAISKMEQDKGRA